MLYKGSLKNYLRFISYIFGVSAETPADFIKVMGATPYQPWYGCASFAAIPTPNNEWGWVYETISHRQLIWLPGDIVLTKNFRNSEIFRGWVEAEFGEPIPGDEPEWLGAALSLALMVERPSDADATDNTDNNTDDNNAELLSAIQQRPLDYFARIQKEDALKALLAKGR